jgi:hypothetical protein
VSFVTKDIEVFEVCTVQEMYQLLPWDTTPQRVAQTDISITIAAAQVQ